MIGEVAHNIAVTASTRTRRCMDKLKRDWHNWLNTATQAITVATIVFFGGAVWRDVQDLKRFKDSMEKEGSPRLLSHERMDDERIDGLKLRVGTIEAAVIVIGDMRGDLKVINSKIDKLQDELKNHEAMTRERFRPSSQ